MSFDLRKLQAEISLDRIPPERLPSVAQNALEAGYDGPAILRMAILERPSGWETNQLLPAFLKELGLTIRSIYYSHSTRPTTVIGTR